MSCSRSPNSSSSWSSSSTRLTSSSSRSRSAPLNFFTPLSRRPVMRTSQRCAIHKRRPVGKGNLSCLVPAGEHALRDDSCLSPQHPTAASHLWPPADNATATDPLQARSVVKPMQVEQFENNPTSITQRSIFISPTLLETIRKKLIATLLFGLHSDDPAKLIICLKLSFIKAVSIAPWLKSQHSRFEVSVTYLLLKSELKSSTWSTQRYRPSAQHCFFCKMTFLLFCLLSFLFSWFFSFSESCFLFSISLVLLSFPRCCHRSYSTVYSLTGESFAVIQIYIFIVYCLLFRFVNCDGQMLSLMSLYLYNDYKVLFFFFLFSFCISPSLFVSPFLFSFFSFPFPSFSFFLSFFLIFPLSFSPSFFFPSH